jgi:hypothetical protein
MIADNVEMVDRQSEVLARAMAVTAGTFFGGSLKSLHNEDADAVFILNDETDTNGTLEVTSVSPIKDAASYGVTVVYKGSRNDLTVFFDARNKATSAWVNLGSGVTSASFQTFANVNTTNPDDFIDQTTRVINGRVRFIPQADLEAADGWTSEIDMLVWDIS